MGGGWRMVVVVVVVVVMEIATAQVQVCPGNAPCVTSNQCQNVNGPVQTCVGGGRELKVCCPGSVAIEFPSVGGESLLPTQCRSGVPSRNFDRVASVSRTTIAKREVKPGRLEVAAPLRTRVRRSVIGGQDVILSQPFPWMAVLGYNSKTNPIWACGGSLITAQYVITAAHCVHADHTGGLTLSVVRLGELDLSTARDCEQGRFRPVCAPIPQDFSPAQILLHPDFNTRTDVSDDIALIRLDKKASYNTFVQPICLPAPGVGVKAALGRSRNGELAGWGLNETLGGTVSVLQRAVIPFVEKTQCNQHFPKLVPEQVCFGGAKQDSCQGDSGGPVFVRGSRGILLLALVSHGLDYRCGTFGVPAVYTDVTAYRSWIVGKLEP